MQILKDLTLCRKPLAGFVVIGMGWAAYFAQMPAIKAHVDVSDGTYGALIFLSSLGALAAMWLAPLASRLAGPLALPLGAAGVAAGFLWAGAAPQIIGLTLGLTLAAAGSGVVDVLANARVAEMEARHARPLMNLNHAMYSFAYAGSALLVGAAREAAWSPLTVFALMALMIAALCVIMAGGDGAAPDIQSPQASFPRGLVWLVGLLVMTAFLSEAGAEGWSALHLERTLGGSPGAGALGPAILGLTMGLGRLCGHAVARHVPDMALLAGACVLSAFGICLAGAAPGLIMAYVGFALGGLGISVVAPLALALVGRIVPPDARLVAISRASVLGYGAFFIGPPLMGLVSEGWGLRMSFYMISGVLALAACVLIPVIAARVRQLPGVRPQP